MLLESPSRLTSPSFEITPSTTPPLFLTLYKPIFTHALRFLSPFSLNLFPGNDVHGIMIPRSASSSAAVPRFLLRPSASSSTPSQQLRDPANNGAERNDLSAPTSPPGSACPSTKNNNSQDIELAALHAWSDSSLAPRIIQQQQHKRASRSASAVVPEGKSASADRELRLTSRGSTASLASTSDSLSKGMTPGERHTKANQIWRGYW